VAIVEESHTPWLLLALITLAGQQAGEETEGLEECFRAAVSSRQNKY
jgi:hypothetical protein